MFNSFKHINSQKNLFSSLLSGNLVSLSLNSVNLLHIVMMIVMLHIIQSVVFSQMRHIQVDASSLIFIYIHIVHVSYKRKRMDEVSYFY